MSQIADAVRSDAAATDYDVQAHARRLEEQLHELNTQLRQAQKLASIGTVAAMLAHECNNLLTPMIGYARYAIDRDDVELMREALPKILRRAETLGEMAERILGLAVERDKAPAPVELKHVVEEAVGCLGRDLSRDKIQLNIQIDSELKVQANGRQLEQVLFNLILNARQAMLGRPGRLTIDAAPDGQGRVCLHVRDTGPGIPPDSAAHVFEPFFTTKRSADRPDKRGLGLGLAVSKDIIEENNGTIEVASTSKSGTTFRIALPAAD